MDRILIEMRMQFQLLYLPRLTYNSITRTVHIFINTYLSTHYNGSDASCIVSRIIKIKKKHIRQRA